MRRQRRRPISPGFVAQYAAPFIASLGFTTAAKIPEPPHREPSLFDDPHPPPRARGNARYEAVAADARL